MQTKLELEVAVSLLTRDLSPTQEQTVPLDEAAGRVLAADVAAPRDQPPFNRSPLDGYALRAADLAGADDLRPAVLRVVDSLCAGQASAVPVGPGQAVRIMTGAMLPQGCDAVVRQEDTDCGTETVAVRRALRPFDNFVPRGDDYRAGDVLLPAGLRLNAAAVGLLASLGMARVSVRRRPRVAVFATGDELAEPGAPLLPGQIYDANRYLLRARLLELGAEPVAAGACCDEPEALARALAAAAAHCDLLITTGGVSVGTKDILHEALPLLGAEQVFYQVRVKPGGHLFYSRCRGTPILSLSGNPYAAAATFEVLAGPALAVLSGCPDLLPRLTRGRLATPFPKASPARRFLRGVFSGGEVTLPDSQASGSLASLALCNCLVDIPAGTGALAVGDAVAVRPFRA